MTGRVTRDEAISALQLAGQLASNACYNLAQDARLDERTRQALRDTAKAWDDAQSILARAAKGDLATFLGALQGLQIVAVPVLEDNVLAVSPRTFERMRGGT